MKDCGGRSLAFYWNGCSTSPHEVFVRMSARSPRLLAGLLVAVGIACESPAPPGESDSAAAPGALSSEGEAFWAALTTHCGQAYAGRLADATPYYSASLGGRAPVIHFLRCSDTLMHVAFHLDDDRSRNWILTRAGGTIRLKHDHRLEDGTEDSITQYGGDAPRPGLPTRQIFQADSHTATILPLRRDNFWFLDLVKAGTLEYGVHWPRLGHSVRFAFDLTRPVPAPPPPWGFGPG